MVGVDSTNEMIVVVELEGVVRLNVVDREDTS